MMTAAHAAEEEHSDNVSIATDASVTSKNRPTLRDRLSSFTGDEGAQPNLLRRLSSSVRQLGRKNSGAAPLPSADEIPANFLRASKGNVEKAAKKWQATKQWREENDIDHILDRPHRNFDTLAAVYPAYLHGRDLQGNVISVEMPGMMDTKVMKAAGLTPKDMTLHMALVQEYVWTVLLPGDDGKITTLMDVKGLSLTKLASADSLALIRAASETLNNHYPERVLRILVVNAPRFFGPMFRLLGTVMPASVRDQLQICNSVEEIEKFIALDHIPKEYGGQCPYPLGQAPEYQGLKALIDAKNAAIPDANGHASIEKPARAADS